MHRLQIQLNLDIMKNAFFSIIIPTKNRKELLSECLRSIVAQSFERWEIIVVDDGSTDGTIEHVEGLGDERVRIVKNTSGAHGACHARNFGAALAEAPYVIFFDSDDLMCEGCLQNRHDTLEGKPELDMVLSGGRFFVKDVNDLHGLVCFPAKLCDLGWERMFLLDMHWGTHAMTWKRAFLDEVGQWNAALPAFQDWELNLRAMLKEPNYEWTSMTYDYMIRLEGDDRISSKWETATSAICQAVDDAMEKYLNDEQKQYLKNDRSGAYPYTRIGHACLRQRQWKNAAVALKYARKWGGKGGVVRHVMHFVFSKMASKLIS